MPFVLPRSREGRKERGNERKKRMERRRVSELTARSPCLYLMAVDRLLFHFVACEYFRRCPDPSDIDSVTARCLPTAKPSFARSKKLFKNPDGAWQKQQCTRDVYISKTTFIKSLIFFYTR